MVKLMRTATLGILVATALAGAPADAQQQTTPQKRPIIIDRSVTRPPPPPHERTYVGPGPAVSPPMERIPNVPPLAQPPIR